MFVNNENDTKIIKAILIIPIIEIASILLFRFIEPNEDINTVKDRSKLTISFLVQLF